MSDMAFQFAVDRLSECADRDALDKSWFCQEVQFALGALGIRLKEDAPFDEIAPKVEAYLREKYSLRPTPDRLAFLVRRELGFIKTEWD